MTMTVKLDAALERALRSRCAAVGCSASALMREALLAYLAQTEPPTPSAYALGHDLFGRHAGPQDLVSQRKAELQQIWDQKHPALPVAPDYDKA
ncbi:MAG: CopG family transcriptional regulator [Rhodoferax sp.]|nr:CopG family transcriptional regulator [Rhodoferax sp.]